MRGRTLLMVAALVLGAARADAIEASPCVGDKWQCRRAAVTFSMEQSLPIEWQFDSGWIPPSSDLQVHLWGAVYASTRIELAGDVVVSWPEVLTIETPGRDGVLGYHYGVDAGAEGKVQVTIANQTYNWQGDLPFIPQVELEVEAHEVFDAWGWAPGVKASDSSAPQRVAQIDLMGLIGPSIPGLSGGFELDIALDLTVSYVNERIVIERPDGSPVDGGDVLAASDASSDSYPGGPSIDLDVHPEGIVRHEPVLHLIPAFYIEVLGNTTSLPLADIPVSLPASEQTWVFEAERVHVPLPDLESYDAIIDFGQVRLGREVEGQYDLAAAGEADVNLLVVSSDPDHFIPNDLTLVLKAGEETTREVRFSPTAARPYLGVLALQSNDPDAPEQLVLLKGEGIEDGQDPLVLGGIETASGCGCRAAGREAPSRNGMALFALALILWRRRAPRAQGRAPAAPAGSTGAADGADEPTGSAAAPAGSADPTGSAAGAPRGSSTAS